MKTSKEEVEKRAYQKYTERGGAHGDDQKDWYEAEKELKGQKSKIKKEKKPAKKVSKTKKK